MKKILILFILVNIVASSGFAQLNPFKKKNKDKVEEQVDDIKEQVDDVEEQIDDVEEQIDDVEKQIKEETKELKDKTEEAKEKKPAAKPKPAKEKASEKNEKTSAKNGKEKVEMSAEAMRKMNDINEQAQQKIIVEEGEASMSTGLQNGYTVFVKGGEANKIEKHWKKYLKSAFSSKTDLDKNGEILSQSVEIPSVGNEVNIYARVKEVSDGVEITTFFDTGENGYLSSENVDGDELIKKLMHDFGVQERVFAIEAQIDDEEKSLKRLEKDLKNLEGDNDKYHKTIEKAKLDIVENEQEQDSKNIEITEQLDIIEAIKKMKDGVE